MSAKRKIARSRSGKPWKRGFRSSGPIERKLDATRLPAPPDEMLRYLSSPVGISLGQIFKTAVSIKKHMEAKALLGLTKKESTDVLNTFILLSIEARDAYVLERAANESKGNTNSGTETEASGDAPKIILAH